MNSTNNKSTVYIDIDDEITSIIDKVRGSEERIVALVLPKRAAVLQSIVNMKLLKRSADEDKKSLVLITSEAGLMPLAGAVGLYVAKTLQTKPEVPAAPVSDSSEEIIQEAVVPQEADDMTSKAVGSRSVGELASLAAAPSAADDVVETLELDDEDEQPADTALEAQPGETPKLPKKDKKLKVPNFDRFRLSLILGGLGLVALIVLLYICLNVLPKASINVKTDATNVNSNVNFTLNTATTTLDPVASVVPAKLVQEQKTYTGSAAASGQQNKGDKASGSVTMTATKCSGNPFDVPSSVPAGTGISVSGLTYITQSVTTFYGSGTSGSCYSYSSTASTAISAQNPGQNYNVSNKTFTVAGRSDVSASGSASGGTDNIVKVVSQADIDSAKQKIVTADAAVKQDLVTQLQKAKLLPIAATFSPGTPAVTTSVNAGDTADSVTVTEVATYTMFGAHESDLKTLVDNNVKTQIDTTKQSILSEGLASGTYKVVSTTATTAQMNLTTTAAAGPDINIASLTQQVEGKKSGEIEALIKNNPGITTVTVHFSPFWVSSAPKKPSKITITVAAPTPSKTSAND